MKLNKCEYCNKRRLRTEPLMFIYGEKPPNWGLEMVGNKFRIFCSEKCKDLYILRRDRNKRCRQRQAAIDWI